MEDRVGIRIEIVVVDNTSDDDTRSVVDSFRDKLPIRYLFEARPGKCHALNRALDEGGLGAIVAFIDDDLTLEPGWVKGVKSACDRWPGHDIFSGRSYAVLPENEPIPAWALNKQCHGWAFSVADNGTEDRELSRGSFFSGNHFWVRRRALANGRRFPELWLTEPGFLLGLQQDGCKGVWTGDAVVGHQIQPHLLRKGVILQRMVQFGKDWPYVYLPNTKLFRKARFYRDHPLVWTCFCTLNLTRWALKYTWVRLGNDSDARLLFEIRALTRLAGNWETVRHSYRLRKFVKEQQQG